ncbi:hypothetical protein CR513_29590, partial [Mucuna pruriens]
MDRCFKSITMMMNEFAITELGKMRYFLGIEVLQGCYGIFIRQNKYIKDMLDRFNMLDCNLVKNPIVPSIKLLKTDQGTEVDSTLFKQLIGSLMFLTATRPNVAHFVSSISHFIKHPKDKHFLAAKRILRYLQGTQNLGFFYKGDLDDKKSTSDYAFMLGGGVISWTSKKQSVVSLSTIEVEFITTALCAYQKGATVMFRDNISTIKLFKNSVLHGRSKHIDVRFYFLRDLCNNGVIQLNYYSTGKQLVDIMTKPLKHLRSAFGIFEKPKINGCNEHTV